MQIVDLGYDNYVTGSTYDHFGRPTLVSFGDSNQTKYSNRDPDFKLGGTIGQGGRLHYYQTGTTAVPYAVQFMSYHYDKAGNVTNIYDVNNPGPSYQGQVFTYDALDRLILGYTSAVGDGDDDIIGFGGSATYLSRSTGTSFEALEQLINNYGYTAGGWGTFDMHPRTVGDVDGNGKDDIVGFGGSYTFVSLSSCTPMTITIGGVDDWTPHFSRSDGYTSFDEFPRLVGDVNGDGKDDLVGFHTLGVTVSLSSGTDFGTPKQWLGWFGNSEAAGGWDSYNDYPRVLADLDGDGKEDILGFKDEGVWVSLSAGDRFLPPTLWVDKYANDAGGWVDFDTYPRMAGDITGNGHAEFVGCGGNRVYVNGHDTYLDFGYDANGAMVSATIEDSGGLTTTAYIGDHQEWTNGVPTNYYFHNGRRVAKRIGNDVSYLHADHDRMEALPPFCLANCPRSIRHCHAVTAVGPWPTAQRNRKAVSSTTTPTARCAEAAR